MRVLPPVHLFQTFLSTQLRTAMKKPVAHLTRKCESQLYSRMEAAGNGKASISENRMTEVARICIDAHLAKLDKTKDKY